MSEAPLPDTGEQAAVNVLVVDDNPNNLLAMQALLQRPGLQVLCAQSGAQALELLLHHEVALALVDVQMPEMDGFALAELMRGAERTSGVPIIFVTASPSDPARAFRGYESGAVDFLYKPIDPQMLAGKVAVFVQLYRQRRLLRERNEALERALKLNETMVAVLTHDLRTPLSAIINSAELLKLRASDDMSRRAANRLRDSSLRMARMVTQLLNFCRIRSGVVELVRESTDLRALCEAAVQELTEAHPGLQAELHVDGDTRGAFDVDRMMQVLTNLIGNAHQHGERGQPVRLALDGRRDDAVRLRVTNAGQVPPELLPVLFDPFRSAGPSAHGGLGLGMFIVQQFVQAHGGSVQARNTCEGGQPQVVVELVLPRGTIPA